jgi:hypothetical protein
VAGEAAPSFASLTDNLKAHGLCAWLNPLLLESQTNSL